MNGWMARAALLADQERFQSLGQNLRGRHAQLSLSEWLLGAACLAAIALAVWIIAKLLTPSESKPAIHHPRRLFRALCRAHAVGFFGKRALWKLAHSAGLQQPGAIFLRPDLFDAGLATASSRRQQAHYARLREKLFGAQLPVEKS
jgi:hypothetical protein